jgi:hypothetical protein
LNDSTCSITAANSQREKSLAAFFLRPISTITSDLSAAIANWNYVGCGTSRSAQLKAQESGWACLWHQRSSVILFIVASVS